MLTNTTFEGKFGALNYKGEVCEDFFSFSEQVPREHEPSRGGLEPKARGPARLQLGGHPERARLHRLQGKPVILTRTGQYFSPVDMRRRVWPVQPVRGCVNLLRTGQYLRPVHKSRRVRPVQPIDKLNPRWGEPKFTLQKFQFQFGRSIWFSWARTHNNMWLAKVQEYYTTNCLLHSTCWYPKFMSPEFFFIPTLDDQIYDS